MRYLLATATKIRHRRYDSFNPPGPYFRGRPLAIATARRGGLYTLENDGLRIQCIWKTDAGGNHHNHVHAGARPTG